ncbi:MAG: 4-hydroxy-tetrahydrodipicolinate reductase [Lachnospiraceae bacterium]|nr:4-hydroxy-tetrahydrodipicolinate reductase [Ruminococcus sp.]MCM1275339.1 4-hydroxy-tetrahydrodipicolinate reductase [Lachnospiraceae bacterium]
MTKIVITGACGHMGRVIAGLIGERADCAVCAGIDKFGEKYADFEVYKSVFDMPEKPDVIIDFSHPSALPDMLNYCKMNSVPLVIGTTGYSDGEKEQITAASAQIPVFFTFNMSLGINLLAELAKKAAQVLGGQFDIEIVEKHHNRKKDAPSGTAIMLAEAVNGELDNSKHYVYDRHAVRRPRGNDEIGMHSVRGGTIVGEHDIIFAGHDEVITLSHSAQSREVFAVGAVNAAVFLSGKGAGLYAMGDIIKEK